MPTLSVGFSRTTNKPIDDSFIWSSLATAQAYVAGATSMAGQPITVLNDDKKTYSMYIVQLDESGDKTLELLKSGLSSTEVSTSISDYINEQLGVTVVPLENGQIPAKYLPDAVEEIINFYAAAQAGMDGDSVFFNAANYCLYKYSDYTANGSNATKIALSNNKIYVCKDATGWPNSDDSLPIFVANHIYRYSGDIMVDVTSPDLTDYLKKTDGAENLTLTFTLAEASASVAAGKTQSDFAADVAKLASAGKVSGWMKLIVGWFKKLGTLAFKSEVGQDEIDAAIQERVLSEKTVTYTRGSSTVGLSDTVAPGGRITIKSAAIVTITTDIPYSRLSIRDECNHEVKDMFSGITSETGSTYKLSLSNAGIEVGDLIVEYLFGQNYYQ